MSQYTAQSLEVLSGLDPVRRRPGMYTDTTRPNHLAQEVIDNAVDEALAGHANKITVTVYKDGSLSVEDNGRGMPVDIHPEYGQSGIEIILTKLHAGGKFSTDNYQFSRSWLAFISPKPLNRVICGFLVLHFFNMLSSSSSSKA